MIVPFESVGKWMNHIILYDVSISILSILV